VPRLRQLAEPVHLQMTGLLTLDPPPVSRNCKDCGMPTTNYCAKCNQYYCWCDWIVARHAH
jgi:hypothetical protein